MMRLPEIGSALRQSKGSIEWCKEKIRGEQKVSEVETTREGIRRKLEGREKQRANVEGHGVGFCNRMKVGKGLGKLGRQGGGEITRIMEIVKLKKDENQND